MVKKLLLFFLLMIPLISAINLNVEKQSSDEVLILGLNEPAVFDLKITNYGDSDNFMIYNLVGLQMTPGYVSINQDETKNVPLAVSPIGNLNVRGTYNFEYTLRGSDKSEISNKLTVKIVELENALKLTASNVDPESESINVEIENRVNFNFEKIDAKLSSPFFELTKSFFLAPYQKKEFNIPLNKDYFKNLNAGFYTLNADIDINGKKAKLEGKIKFDEKSLLRTEEKNSGFIITTKAIKKINEGNTLADSQVVLRKNIISRLFTTFSPEPDTIQRQGFTVFYTWKDEIKPGDVLNIVVKTNWLFPVLIIFLIVAVTIFVRQYSKTNLVLRKKITFVKAKGGEFALKVSILVNAKKYVERINVTDRLPLITKIYEKFGGEQPSRVDEKNRKIEWNFQRLEAGETRILSYVIYSKIGVLGKFALPRATAVYEREGEISEAESNIAFFIAEQLKKDIE